MYMYSYVLLGLLFEWGMQAAYEYLEEGGSLHLVFYVCASYSNVHARTVRRNLWETSCIQLYYLPYTCRFLVWGLEGLAEIAREAVRRARASERDPIALALIGTLPDSPSPVPSAHGRDSSGSHTGGEPGATSGDELDSANPYAEIVLKLTGCLLNGLKVMLNITQENGTRSSFSTASIPIRVLFEHTSILYFIVLYSFSCCRCSTCQKSSHFLSPAFLHTLSQSICSRNIEIWFWSPCMHSTVLLYIQYTLVPS